MPSILSPDVVAHLSRRHAGQEADTWLLEGTSNGTPPPIAHPQAQPYVSAYSFKHASRHAIEHGLARQLESTFPWLAVQHFDWTFSWYIKWQITTGYPVVLTFTVLSFYRVYTLEALYNFVAYRYKPRDNLRFWIRRDITRPGGHCTSWLKILH